MASKCVLLPGNNTLIKYQLPWLTFVASRIITVVNVLSEFSTLMWLFQVIIGPLSVVSMCVCGPCIMYMYCPLPYGCVWVGGLVEEAMVYASYEFFSVNYCVIVT